jgi:sporulation-control protein spo0M
MTVQLQLGNAQYKLEEHGRIFAGRDPAACQLAFGDATLSRRHAEVFVENGQAFIRDLGSANGTWVDGQHLGHEVVPLHAGQQIWLGHVQLGMNFVVNGSATVMAADVPAELKALIAARQQQLAQVQQTPGSSMPAAASQPLPSASQTMQTGGALPPLPTTLAYRKQGSNSNGVLLLALPQDTFFNGQEIEGFVEFTCTDSETIASIFVELVELKRGGPAEGHTWDRFMVRQGPWRAKDGDVLPLPFKLRVPPGTPMSSPDVYWEIRGYVDIAWASDIDAKIGINMRNQDIERVRDALGSLDYRLGDMKSVSRGQRFEAEFFPPANLAKQWGINEIEIAVEYLGTNIKVHMKIDRKGLHRDPQVDQVFDIARLRAASQGEINATIKQMIDNLLPQK